MSVQWAVVAVVVALSAAYAAWTLMPASLRRVLATASLRLPLPAPLARRMRAHAERADGCGCSGCDHNPGAAQRANAAVPVQPIKLHRRIPG
jgi:hypothetical protein